MRKGAVNKHRGLDMKSKESFSEFEDEGSAMFFKRNFLSVYCLIVPAVRVLLTARSLFPLSSFVF